MSVHSAYYFRAAGIMGGEMILSMLRMSRNAYRGFTWVFYALASPHFNVVEVRPRNY